MRYVVFLDLDNTFWTEEGVPDSALEAIRRAQANGHRVFSNTGRSRGECRELLRYGLDGRCYAAGAEVFFGEQKLVDHPLGVAMSHTMMAALDVGKGILIAEGGDRTYIRAYDQDYFQDLYDLMAKANDPFIDHPDISCMSAADHAQIYKYSLFMAGGVPEEIKAAIPEGYVPTTMGDATEFTNKNISKATALNTVRSALEEIDGVTYQTMALGDSGNDLSMLRMADVSVCMGNGTDEAKAVADYVTKPIDEDGLFCAFEHFGLI
ncbi:MAG: HAD family hydrolase [Coriobacteriales bacterium]|nr:HAD family hydrolase [Coriobacteriales bacterium]